ncbi:MAG: aldo/keto reductase [Anaerolineae bacterium]
MRTIELGHTGLRVSEVGFGGIPIQRLSHDEAVAVVRGCLDLGITLLDTAHGYTTSEERIGAAIAGRRQGLVLTSKTPATTAADARAHLELSLRRLNVEHIDIYQLHNVSTERLTQVLAPGGAVEALKQAQEQGLIGHIGITCHQKDAALRAVRAGVFATMMFPFGTVGAEPGLEVLAACREAGMGFFAMKPMGGGMYESARPAFQWLRQYPDAIPVVGIERVAEMREIVELYREPADLSPADRAEIERLQQELGGSYCRRCDYCQPCPAGIRMSAVLVVPSAMKRMPATTIFAPGWPRDEVAKVGDCQDCGACEERCPYQLPIRRLLKQVAERYWEAERAFRET